MHSEMSTPPLPGHAPPSGSTVQRSQGSTRHGDWDCQLEHRHHTAAPVETWESQYPGPSSGGACDVSIPEALQLPITPSQVLARCSGVVRVTSSLDYAIDQNRPSSIDPRLIDHTHGPRVMQGHASNYAVNHDITLLPSYYGVEWPSGYPQGSGGVPTLGGLDNSFAALVMGVGPIPPHDGTAGQVIDSNVPRSHPPTSVPTSAEEPHPRLPALEYASAHQALTHIPSQSNSTSYPTPMSSQNSSSWFLQEDPRYFTPVQPHSQQIYSTGSPGFHTGNQMELPAPSSLDDHVAQGHSDHPSHTLSDPIPCGWRDDEGNECGTPIQPDDCKDHFAASHGIKNIKWDVKISCRWCSSEKEIIRKFFLRHMKEVHLGCSRSNNKSTDLP